MVTHTPVIGGVWALSCLNVYTGLCILLEAWLMSKPFSKAIPPL